MKAAKKASSINEIAKVHTRLVRSKDDLTAAEARHGEIENEYGDLLERFVVTTAQQAGLMRLPPAVIQAGIHYLAVAGKDPSLVAEWNAAPGVPDAVSVSTDAEAGGVRSTGRRSRRPGPDEVIVVVKITKREGERCVPNLRSSGVKWSGKHNHYRGVVDASDVDKLRTRFPSCVTVDGQDNLVNDVLNGGAPDGISGARGNPLTMPEPSPANIDAGRGAGSDDPRSGAGDPQPRAEADETGSDACDEGARSKSEDVGLPQVTFDQRPQTRSHGISPFNRLPVRPTPKGS